MKMNFRRRGSDPVEIDSVPATLIAELETLYRPPTPELPFDPTAFTAPALPSPGAATLLHRHWKLAITASAALLIAAAIAIPVSLGGDTQAVDAQTVLGRAQNAAILNQPATTPSYHLVATTEYAGKGTVTTETWYRDSTHFRTEEHTPARDSTVIADGDSGWFIETVGTQTAVVHLTGSAAIIPPLIEDSGASDDGLVGLLQQTSAESGCQSATNAGLQTFDGRTAYVITISASPSPTCGVQKLLYGTQGGSVTAWIDQQTSVPLKAEERDATGTIMFQYTVTQFQVGESIPSSTFAYQPAAGVTPVTATTGMEVKEALKNFVLGGVVGSPGMMSTPTADGSAAGK